MATGRFVSYLRVSTDKQGRSGLGLEAQRAAVAGYLDGGRWELVAEHVEIETGKRADRPVLAQALAACRLHRAVLVLAKLDRLARDAHFLLGLQKAGVEFVACDMPTANRLTIGIMALVAEEEARAISARTKAALAAAKARGVRLGGNPENLTNRAAGNARSGAVRAAKADARAAEILPVIDGIRAAGVTSALGIARALNGRGIPAARGGRWTATQVQRILARA
jgi:DNA invertase Pin-like site-specific DNA recombinase